MKNHHCSKFEVVQSVLKNHSCRPILEGFGGFWGFPRGCNAGESLGWVGERTDSCQLLAVGFLATEPSTTDSLFSPTRAALALLKLPSNAEPQSENLWKRYMSGEQLEDLNPEIAMCSSREMSTLRALAFRVSVCMYMCECFYFPSCSFLQWLHRCHSQEVMNESWFPIFCWLRFYDNWDAFIWKDWAISPACFPPVSKSVLSLWYERCFTV